MYTRGFGQAGKAQDPALPSAELTPAVGRGGRSGSSPQPHSSLARLLRAPLELSLLLLLSVGVLGGCARYDLLTEEVYEQVSFSNQLDLLLIFDTSDSMAGEQSALSDASTRFIESLSAAALQEQSFPKETLGDAVANLLFFVQNFSRFVNLRVGVTSMRVDPLLEAPGANGQLYPPFPEDPLAKRWLDVEDPELVERFAALLQDIPLDPAAGLEEGLEASRQAICRSLEAPDAWTADPGEADCSDLPAEALLENGPFLRDDVALLVLVVSDEGDFSPYPVEAYLAFLEHIQRPFGVVAIAPTLADPEDPESTSCNPEGASAESIARYDQMTSSSGGALLPVCEDFVQALDTTARLINRLLLQYRLRKVPDPASIQVFVNGVEVLPDAQNGWSFQAEANTLVFHGSAVPDFSARIQVVYRAVAATDPRPLPF